MKTTRKQLEEINENINEIKKIVADSKEFDKRMIELCKLRIKIKKYKSIVGLSNAINSSDDLKSALRWITRKLDDKNGKEKFLIIRSRTLSAIDGIISNEVQSRYNLEFKK